MGMNWRKQNKHKFYQQQAHIEDRVKEQFISDNNTAIIPCRVKDYYDIIHPFSVEGYEAINPEFTAYVADVIRFIPVEYPVVLDITGCNFSDEQKKRIVEALKVDAIYELGAIETEGKALKDKLIYMLCGLFAMGIFLTVMNFVITGMPREFFLIVFWFFADFIISYLLWDRREYQNELILAGRMVSMEVTFQKTFH